MTCNEPFLAKIASEVTAVQPEMAGNASLEPLHSKANPVDSPQLNPAKWTEPDPYAEATSPTKVYEAMLRYVESGLSVIPIEAWDGSKAPDSSRLPRYLDPSTGQLAPTWQVYRLRLPSIEEIARWHARGSGVFGLAIVCGAVSGGAPGSGLEIVDFDTADLAEPWMVNVEQRCPGLIAKLPHVQTPGPGHHFYYRCSRYVSSQKLAFGQEQDAQGRLVRVGLIETKGEGGYCLAPPSPRRCHPSHGLYLLAEGSPDLTQIPAITVEERAVLLDEARKFNTWVGPENTKTPRKSAVSTLGDRRPGDDFNQKASWEQILLPHGWVKAGPNGEEVYWRRPGKLSGLSATTNYRGSDLLHVFTSSAYPFEADESYDKFAAYGLLNHGGDFSAAARVLRDQGYGG